MPRLSDEKINEIRQSVDIVDVIGNYLTLTRKGRNYMALCPFHNDSHPSMSISQEKQIYMCFVCHNGGNVFTFLQRYLKIDYFEAVKMVAKMGNVDISDYVIPEKKPQVNEALEPYYLMHEEAHKIYKHYLSTKLALEAKDYLNSRGLTQDIIDNFGVGYAPGNNILMNALTKNGFTPFQIYSSGLVIESKSNYDRYKDRIMFPLHNSSGRIVGFSGRIYKKNQTESKYMNSPESDIFIKSETLYNYHRVKESVRQAGHVIVLEGFMDVIALYKAGIENAVAIMGTAFTNGHIQLLKRLTKNIILCLDGDQAGQSAMMKCIDLLKQHGLNPQVVILPDGLDPDEYLSKYGREALHQLFKKPISSIEFVMNYSYSRINVDNYEDKKDYLTKMTKLIASLDDEIDREYYKSLLYERTKFSDELISKMISSMTVQTLEHPHVRYERTRQVVDKYQKAERDLLYYMLNDKKYAQLYEAKAGYMYDKLHRIIASYIVDYYRRYAKLELAHLISYIKDQEIIQRILEISSLDLPPLDNNQAIEDYIRLIQERFTKERIEELEVQLKNTFDPTAQAQILQEIIRLQEKR